MKGLPYQNGHRIKVSILRDAYRLFQANDPLRMAAATAFFASFALPPILIILVETLGVFGNARTYRHGLLDQLGVTLDRNVALQVREILRNVHYLSITPGMRIAGFVFLLFVATTLFEVIRNSLNQLWRIRLKEKPSVAFILIYRLRSIVIILTAGVLIALILWINNFFYHLVTIMAGMVWFSLVLRYQSYGRPAWSTAIAGGIFTGLLFTAGELLLHFVLSYNNMSTIYGTSTSLVLLLLFIFYCSFIFYFGACFTIALSESTGQPIKLTSHAVNYRIKILYPD